MTSGRLQKILVTGGAGFVGSSLAERLSALGRDVTVMDNLMRKGSELNVKRLEKAGIKFVRGDIRYEKDWEGLPAFDLIVDCAAEPSVHAGATSSPMLVIETNLNGTVMALEKARRDHSAFLFLSTSRVYSIRDLCGIALEKREERFEIMNTQSVPGISRRGIAENFPCHTYRSFYGTTKLASEQLIQEYAAFYGMKAMINRCGVIAGPYQMGKVDQGVTALWVARHIYKKPLTYIGFGGQGHQVRDVLHPSDLFDLIQRQMNRVSEWDAQIYNVGGGPDISFSLSELTRICRDVTGHTIEIGSIPETAAVDIPLYITDTTKVSAKYDWSPQRSVRSIVEDIHTWIKSDEQALKSIFC